MDRHVVQRCSGEDDSCVADEVGDEEEDILVESAGLSAHDSTQRMMVGGVMSKTANAGDVW